MWKMPQTLRTFPRSHALEHFGIETLEPISAGRRLTMRVTDGLKETQHETLGFPGVPGVLKVLAIFGGSGRFSPSPLWRCSLFVWKGLRSAEEFVEQRYATVFE